MSIPQRGDPIDPGPSIGVIGQNPWNGKKMALSLLAIIILLVLWEKAPSIGGPLIFVSIFALLMHGVRSGTIHLPS